MEIKLPEASVGVIVGRFQVPELHKAHRELIETVRAHHKRVIILLGVSPVRITRNNPLDFMTRHSMLSKAYPNIAVLPVKDMGDDNVWSARVDSLINSIIEEKDAVIYGSRDSFIPHYKGKFRTIELAPKHKISGSEIRRMASEEIRSSRDFRAGVVYAAFNRYPISYQTVDAAIIKDGKQVLLGKKNNDDGDRWRFFGGFVRPEDTSLEEAVKREAFEETSGMSTGAPKYIGSFRVQDWRYKDETDKILTSLFILPYSFGATEASDDVDSAKWFTIKDIRREDIVPSHQVLLDALLKHLKLPVPKQEEVTEVENEMSTDEETENE